MKENLILLTSERSKILLLKDGTLQLYSRTWTREELCKASISNAGIIPKDIYEFSNDEPEDGDWCIDKYNQLWGLFDNKLVSFDKEGNRRFSTDDVIGHVCKKITHTTNQDLIFRHDIPELDSQYVEQFISNYNQEP